MLHLPRPRPASYARRVRIPARQLSNFALGKELRALLAALRPEERWTETIQPAELAQYALEHFSWRSADERELRARELAGILQDRDGP